MPLRVLEFELVRPRPRGIIPLEHGITGVRFLVMGRDFPRRKAPRG